MMAHFQQSDRVQQPAFEHVIFGGALGVAGQENRTAAIGDFEDERIVVAGRFTRQIIG